MKGKIQVTFANGRFGFGLHSSLTLCSENQRKDMKCLRISWKVAF